MKYLALIFLLIVCASAANTNKPANNKKNKGGIQGRYDVPPGAEVPNGNDSAASENLSLSTSASRAENDGSSSSINPFADDNDNGSSTGTGNTPVDEHGSNQPDSNNNNYYGNNYQPGGSNNGYPSSGSSSYRPDSNNGYSSGSSSNGYPSGSSSNGYPSGSSSGYPSGSSNNYQPGSNNGYPSSGSSNYQPGSSNGYPSGSSSSYQPGGSSSGYPSGSSSGYPSGINNPYNNNNPYSNNNNYPNVNSNNPYNNNGNYGRPVGNYGNYGRPVGNTGYGYGNYGRPIGNAGYGNYGRPYISMPGSNPMYPNTYPNSYNPYNNPYRGYGYNYVGDKDATNSEHGTDWINPNQPNTNPIPGRDTNANTDPNQPQPNQPDTNQPQPNQPDTNQPQPNQPDTNLPQPGPDPNSDNGDDNSGDENCICVPYYQCQDGNIITDGSGLIDPRKKTNKEVPLDRALQPPNCGTYHVCCSEPERKPLNNYVHRCGLRNPNGINSRALSANEKGEAEFGEWPYMATVLKVDESNSFYFQCGAVLISDSHVLTVAHCLNNLDPQSLVVRLGEWDTQSSNELLPHVDYRVQDFKVHEKFVQSNLHNDIALITLAQKVKFEPHIDSVCLPRQVDQFDGQNCVVMGWGKKDYKGGSYSNIMKKVNLPIVGHDVCQEMLRKTRLGARFKLHQSFICAGGQAGKDSCKGDGGGPIVCYRNDGTYALAGLVAWGIDCGSAGVPGVYTNVKGFLNWIEQNSGQNIGNLQGNSN